MPVSTRNRIRLSGLRDLKETMFELKYEFINERPVINKIRFNIELLPFDIADYPDANVLLTLKSRSGSFYYNHFLGPIREIELPSPNQYTHGLGDKSKLDLKIRKSVNGKDAGLLLASTRHSISLDAPEGKDGDEKGILNVVARDLGDLIWDLDIDDSDGLATLIINNRESVIGKDFAKTSIFFRTVVFPKVIEDVTYFYLQREDWEESEMEYCRWWMNDWALEIMDQAPPEYPSHDGGLLDYQNETREWAKSLAILVSQNQSFFEQFKSSIDRN